MRKRGRPPYPDILTPREWEVLALLRDGLTNEQIAERLKITRHAVRYHVSEILSKLGVSSRQEAAGWEPDKAKPLWMGALTFLLWPLKHLPFGVAARATGAAVVIATAGGIGLLAWGVVVTNSEDNDNVTGSVPVSTVTMPPESPDMPHALLDVQSEMDRLAAAVNAGSIPTENAECALTAAEGVPSELRVACGTDGDDAIQLFEATRGGWPGDQPPPETVLPPKVFDNLRQMIDFIAAGGLQSGETAVLWYNGEVADVTWFLLHRPPVLDVVDAEISRLIEADWFRTQDTFYESRYHHFTGELRVAIGPEPYTAAIMTDWPGSPWPVPQPLPEPDVPTEQIAQSLHRLVDSILVGDLGDGDTAILWYKPQTGEVLTWVGSNPWLDLFGVPAPLP